MSPDTFGGLRRYDTGDYFGALMRWFQDEGKFVVEIHASYDGFIRDEFDSAEQAETHMQKMLDNNFYIDPYDHIPTEVKD